MNGALQSLRGFGLRGLRHYDGSNETLIVTTSATNATTEPSEMQVSGGFGFLLCVSHGDCLLVVAGGLPQHKRIS